jgi:hypothetical protein
MLAVKKDFSVAVYSKGKTGTTTLLNSLTNDWWGVGEFEVNFLTNETISQWDAVQYLSQRGILTHVVVRDPWRRFVSGIKEILQDSIFSIADESLRISVWQYFMTNADALRNQIDKLYYLSTYKHGNPGHALFALHENYHTVNWLHQIEQINNANIVNSTDLDLLIPNLGLELKAHSNVSEPNDITAIERAILCCNSVYFPLEYVQKEVDIYNKYFPHSQVKIPDPL